MRFRIIHKTAIHKVFTGMIGFFLIALILVIARRYLVAGICLAAFGILFWKWRLLLGEELLLTLLAQNAGRLRNTELAERFSMKNADEAIARLIKKGIIHKEQEMVVLTGPGPAEKPGSCE